MKNSYLDRQKANPMKSGRRAEALTAKRHSARLVPGSGAANAKGDFSSGSFLFEHKATLRGSMSLPLEWLIKIELEATALAKLPALAITYTTAASAPRPSGAWVMLREADFQSLVARAGPEV
ncbi:hypothetical protein [Roseococcus pinisoli]|uniref:Uncharacterized protein n=1 Tax=Roseococcus pinisoli TaxID=2835040 RepID=A0ABS5QG77_9PROT|nr:hypothetical protein [Roseococcus pinisoli]MBS7812321.1 hypothetical protein [Roseococcus pinisoli]